MARTRPAEGANDGADGADGGAAGTGARTGLLGAGWLDLRASLGRRIGALFIDWAACWGVVLAFGATQALWPLAVFWLENVIFVGTLGFSLGHRITGLHVVRIDGQRAGIGRAVIRSTLLILVLPAVVWDSDGRGLHDKAAGTAIVRIPRR